MFMSNAAHSFYECEDSIELRTAYLYEEKYRQAENSLIQVPQSQTSSNLLIRLWSTSWLLNGRGFLRQLQEFTCKKQ